MATNDQVVALLKQAVAAVDAADVPTELRATALKIAAEQLGVSAENGEGGKGHPEEPAKDTATSGKPLTTIASKLGIQAKDAASLFDVDEDGVHLLVARSRLATSKKTAMKEVFQLMVAARQALGEEWTPVNDVRDVAEDRGVLNVPNWAAAVKALDGAGFRFKGTAQAREVKINHVGYEAAANVVRRLVSGD